MKAIALCHNVTPVLETETSDSLFSAEGGSLHIQDALEVDEEETVLFQKDESDKGQKISYQASSPDEVITECWDGSFMYPSGDHYIQVPLCEQATSV